MDLKLTPHSSADFAMQALRQQRARLGLDQIGPTPAGALAQPGAVQAPGGSFSVALSSALKSVSAAQMQASQMQRELQMDNPTVSLEETMVNMQKAQIGFQAALQVRNRLVQAYSDIMNMPV